MAGGDVGPDGGHAVTVDPTAISVVRPHYGAGARAKAVGTAFFLRVGSPSDAVAVTTAHSHELADLAAAGRVEFRLARSGTLAAVSERFLVRPGRPFHAPGSSLDEDFLVFKLAAPPVSVRVLDAAPRLPVRGDRVRLLGIPGEIPADEDDLFGTVARATPERIEVDLDIRADLRGWGGAPLLREDDDRVVGILEAAWPEEGRLRVAAAPVGAVLAALDTPLAGGEGHIFARYAPARSAPAGKGVAPSPVPSRPDRPATAASDSRRPAAPSSGSAPAGGSAEVAAAPPSPPPILAPGPAGTSEIRLEVEYPPDGAVLGDAAGAFVAGRALAAQGELRLFDVVLVLDTSSSTAQASGADVNGNGIVGRSRGGLAGLFSRGSSDPGDSILAAEVAAALRFVENLDPRATRVAVVTFAGEPPSQGGGVVLGRRRAPAVTEVELTEDYARVRQALAAVLRRGPEGATHMAAGVDQATIELMGLVGALSQPRRNAEKIVLFLTDGQPTLPYEPTFMADNVRAVLRAADRARRAGIRIHSFALGPEALEGPIAPVEMAARTGGVFMPVRDPGDVVDLVEEVRFTDVAELHVENRTLDRGADSVLLNPDGSFSALVPLRPGLNRLRVTARTDDGATASRDLTVSYAPDHESPEIPRAFLAQRSRLLEQKLLELRQARLEAEREAAERTRRELRIEIERERAAARERAARQRKELEIEIEPRPATPSEAPTATQGR